MSDCTLFIHSGSHTGEYIGETFLEMLAFWGIDTDRVLLVLRDGGANMVKGMRLIELPDWSCCAHTLQLVVGDGLAAQRVVGDIIAKLKHIATHFNHSLAAKQKLHAIQDELGVERHTILQAVQTRWNSVLYMMQRMHEQRRALTLYGSEFGGFNIPEPEQWDIVSKLVLTLSPFEEVTKELSRNDTSASCILPILAVLKLQLQQQGENTRGIQTLRSTMLQSLTRRFASAEKTKEVVLACFLDPRYKDRPMKIEVRSKAKEWLREESEKDAEIAGRPGNPTEAENNAGGDPKRARVEDCLEDLYASVLSSDEPAAATVRGIDDEIESYLRESVIDRKSGKPLEWWKENSTRYKTLSKMARRYLCAPPSSVPSERVFSTVGEIYDDKRSSLHGDNAEKLCFLHYNLPLLNWEY